MSVISVKNLKKYYQIYHKDPGIKGSLKSLFDRQYKEKRAVDDISFEIEEGELVGFIGPNGAGKTTTLKCLSGLLYPSSGEISVLGYTPFDRKETFLKKISLVMGQKNQLWWDLPATESFLLNKEIYEIPDSQYRKTVDELVDLLDLKDVVSVQVRKLSLGQRMKCELIASLLHNPRIIFLDEPTIGLDVVMQKKLRDFVRNYNQKYSTTILLTSHYMEDVRQLCKRIIVIDYGKIIYDGKLDDIVKKYARNKQISVIFSDVVKREDVEKLGKVKHFELPKVTISVPNSESNRVAAHLLEKFPVEDITIEDPDIEVIIRSVFTNKS